MRGRNYQEMVESYRDGDNSAIDPIVGELSESLYRCIDFIIRNPEESKDLVQEAFVRFVNAIRQGVDIRDVEDWLYRVARNLVIDRYRKGRRSREVPFSDEIGDRPDRAVLGPEEELIAGELLFALDTCMQSFPPDIRAVLAAYLFGLNLRQIAKTLEMKLSDANNMWTRNRMQLWDCVKHKVPEIGA